MSGIRLTRPEKTLQTDLLRQCRDWIDRQQFHEVLELIWTVVRAANVYVDQQAPWALRKTNPERMGQVLYAVCECLRNIAILMQPFVPQSAGKMLEQLEVPLDERTFAYLGRTYALRQELRLPPPQGVFRAMAIRKPRKKPRRP